jgi:hypothetical protein
VTLRILVMELEVDVEAPALRARAEASDKPLQSRRPGRDAHPVWRLGDLRRRGDM